MALGQDMLLKLSTKKNIRVIENAFSKSNKSLCISWLASIGISIGTVKTILYNTWL